MDAALRQTPKLTPEERELERENTQLKKLVTQRVMQNESLGTALDTERAKRPTRPGKSSR
jgi:hypothetical protein